MVERISSGPGGGRMLRNVHASEAPMRRLSVVSVLTVLVVSLAAGFAPVSRPLGATTAPRPGIDWPQFRGISAAGVAEGFSLPATWNISDGTNVLWKTPIPGLGLSSPVVWGDDVFI